MGHGLFLAGDIHCTIEERHRWQFHLPLFFAGGPADQVMKYVEDLSQSETL